MEALQQQASNMESILSQVQSHLAAVEKHVDEGYDVNKRDRLHAMNAAEERSAN